MKQLHQIVLKELQGYINDVVSMEFCSSVCLSCLLSFFLFFLFFQTQSTVGAINPRLELLLLYVTNGIT